MLNWPPDAGRGHLGTTTTAGSQADRNAGFIRQAGEWHWGLPDESGVPVMVSGCARAGNSSEVK